MPKTIKRHSSTLSREPMKTRLHRLIHPIPVYPIHTAAYPPQYDKPTTGQVSFVWTGPTERFFDNVRPNQHFTRHTFLHHSSHLDLI